MKWKDIIFDDFCRLNRGFDLPNDNIVEGDVPVVASSSIKAFHNVAKVKGPGVVTGRSGTLGIVQYIEQDFWPLNTSLYVKDFKGNSPKFCFYFLQMMHLENFNAGAGVPTLNQNHLHKLKIKVPATYDEQEKVASVLSNYDTLIDINTKRIKLLEESAHELYKEWFVRMRFPGYEQTKFVKGIPENWKLYSIQELCDINTNTFNSKNKLEIIHYLDTGSITDNSITDFVDIAFAEAPSRARRVAKHNSILFSMVRPNLRHWGILKNPVENTIVSTGFVVLDCKYNIANIVYNFISSDEIVDYCQNIAEAAVATYPSIKPEEIARLKIALPPIHIAEELNEKIETFISEQKNLQLQNQELAATRDRLLPRLLSGELKVKA